MVDGQEHINAKRIKPLFRFYLRPGSDPKQNLPSKAVSHHAICVDEMMANLSNWGGPGSGGNGIIMGARSSGVVLNASSAAPLPRVRTEAREPCHAAGEESMSRPQSTMLSVSPRSAPPPAYCISLVTTACEHASDMPLHSPSAGEILPPPRGCRQQLLFSQDLTCLPVSSPTRYCCTRSTSLVVQSLPVRPDRHSAGSLAAVAEGPALVNTDSAVNCALPILANSAMCSVGSNGGSGGGDPLPDASSVRSLLNAAWPHLALDSMRIVPVPALPRLQRIYELRVSFPSGHDTAYGTHEILVLVLAPPSMLRLLRSEQWIVKSEAVVVKWIRGVLMVGGSARATKAEYDYEEECPACSVARDRHHFQALEESPLRDEDMLKLLPALIDHSQSTKKLGSAYNILSHLNGLSLSSLPKCLSIPERKDVDFQAGRLIRRLSHLRSPSGRFGPAISVLYPTAVAQSRAGGSMDTPGGVESWSLAFHAILEGILRDAEDMAVTIPYQTIRRHFRRLGCYLDAVAVPRLVILDAAHDSNIMVERVLPGHSDARMKMKMTMTMTLQDLLEDSDDSDPDKAGLQRQSRENGMCIRVTGLRNWSNCIFADPLMAMVFSDKPSLEFLHGFSGRRPRQSKDGGHLDEDGGGGSSSCCCFESLVSAYGDVVECPEEAHIRLLLYQCYHTTVAVVKEFYRPRSDSTSREFAARKRLNVVLSRLEEIEGDPKRGHVRPSGKMSPAKKPRTEDGDEDVDG